MDDKENQASRSEWLGILEDYTRYDKEDKPLNDDTKKVEVGFGRDASLVRPFYTKELSQTTADMMMEASARIINQKAFEGRWQTYITEDNKLMIPESYKDLLKYGGVICKSTDKHLMLFGKEHWEHMKQVLARNMGLQPDSNAVVRHVYGSAEPFDRLNKDGSITLTDDLVKYGRLRGKVALIGLIYYAEVHSMAHYDDLQLSPEEVKILASALV
jgi:DNA-binding transcriptional regulator/RsmH inhibitor MraZ